MSAGDKWKLDMLRKMWGGEDDDPEKHIESQKPGTRKSKGARDSKWPSIDLHNYRELSEQLRAAEKAIDQAISGGHNGIVIIHGKGQGILRSQLLKDLKTHHHIAEFRSIKDAFGESGSIRVRFK